MNAMSHPLALPRVGVRPWLWNAATVVLLLSMFGLISCGKNIPKDYPRTASYSFEPGPDSPGTNALAVPTFVGVSSR